VRLVHLIRAASSGSPVASGCHCEFTPAGSGRPALDETEVVSPRIRGTVVIPAQAGTQPLLITCLRLGSRLRGNECVREDALSAGCKSPPREVTSRAVESNCFAAMRGGEQLEADGQPVG
jgi:hypothetical protein